MIVHRREAILQMSSGNCDLMVIEMQWLQCKSCWCNLIRIQRRKRSHDSRWCLSRQQEKCLCTSWCCLCWLELLLTLSPSLIWLSFCPLYFLQICQMHARKRRSHLRTVDYVETALGCVHFCCAVFTLSCRLFRHSTARLQKSPRVEMVSTNFFVTFSSTCVSIIILVLAYIPCYSLHSLL